VGQTPRSAGDPPVAQNNRYSRQIRFPGLGATGQAYLATARVAIVGCGALGGLQAESLARAGVGHITIIDRDFVESSNLQRQFLFSEEDAAHALPKALAAETRLRQINSMIEIHGVVADLDPDSIADLLDQMDLILDATDNFETRFLINDFSVARTIPWIYGAAVGSYGLMMPVLPGDTPCFRCIYPEAPQGTQPTCETAGVLGSITMLIASLQAGEALKILSGNQKLVRRGLVTADVWTGGIREIQSPARDPECPACAKREFTWLNGSRRAPVSLCGRNAVQIHERRRPVNLMVLKDSLAGLGRVLANDFALRFFRDPYEMTVFPDGRAIIKGTTDLGVARSLYSQYIGS
jgi:molybdopterin/thiamine biosynthesis adenylyltransferase